MSRRSKLSTKSRSHSVKNDKDQRTLLSYFGEANKKPSLFSTIGKSSSSDNLTSIQQKKSIEAKILKKPPDSVLNNVCDHGGENFFPSNKVSNTSENSENKCINKIEIPKSVRPTVSLNSPGEKNLRKRCNIKGVSPASKRILITSNEDSIEECHNIKNPELTSLRSVKCGSGVRNILPLFDQACSVNTLPLENQDSSEVSDKIPSVHSSLQNLETIKLSETDPKCASSKQAYGSEITELSNKDCHAEPLKPRTLHTTVTDGHDNKDTDEQITSPIALERVVKDDADLNTTTKTELNDIIKADGDVSFSEEVEDGWLTEELQKLSPFKCEPERPQSKPSPTSKTDFELLFAKAAYCKVQHVEYLHEKSELLLSFIEAKTGCIGTCTLQGSWTITHVKEGDNINILAPSADSHVTITDNSGLIVVNPDLLISSTTVMSSLFCMRKAVLQEKFHGWEPGNFVMLIGSLVHQLFQEVVKNKLCSEAEVMQVAKSLLQQLPNLHEMYSQHLEDEQVLNELASYLPHILKWVEMFVQKSSPVLPKSKYNREKKSIKSLNEDSSGETVQVTSVKDIEDSIWCPTFGIKGKIDLTLDVKIHKERKMSQKIIVPLELKTGRPTFSSEHEGQVMLYSLMMGARSHGDSFTDGLLLYLKEGPQMKWVKSNFHHIRSLVQLRNELTYYFEQQIQQAADGDLACNVSIKKLPEPINNRRGCERCSHLMSCCLFQKAVEGYQPSNPSHPMVSLMPASTGHLLDSHLEYFKKWYTMLHLEMEEANGKIPKAFWNQDSSHREKKGTCFSKMILKTPLYSKSQDNDDNILHVFQKSVNGSCSKANLKQIGITVNDRITVSTDMDFAKEIAIAIGTVTEITDISVTVLLDSNLYRRSDWQNCLFRLDRVTSSTSFSVQLTNLLRLMSSDPNALRLRQLIIDNKPPSFLEGLSKTVVTKGRPILKDMNQTQQRAVLKSLMAKDYMLIRGMPGTGKTSTIVALVRLLVQLGNSVLITSYTHSAVDNILMKLKKYDIDFIRLGSLTRIRKELHQDSAEFLTKNITDIKKLNEFYNSKSVIATTCLGTSHVLFSHRKFDICIVDEASQVLQTACLGPLFHCERFILVGDSMQLPPVVQSKSARKMGMNQSLFVSLESPNNIAELTIQYRMNRPIMQLANDLTYKGVLTCGSESIANNTLNLPLQQDVLVEFSGITWMHKVLAQELDQSVVFLNTDTMPAPEVADDNGLPYNKTEAEVVMEIMQALSKGGLLENEVGIISPYRKQASFIRESLSEAGFHDVEVNTVDQYQGRDKKVIIMSFVRSNQADNIESEILSDERRINVAITRAKVKLVMVGSVSTLQRIQPLEKLLSAIQDQQIINLPSI